MPTATFHTSKGSFSASLFPEHAPKTVENFVGLSTGTKTWRHPGDGRSHEEALYPGTVFHRVIEGFMIQGGDPLGDGTVGPGYRFEDEVPSGVPSFDRPGLLAMANAGPNTNGSQFFVTVAPTPWLDGLHTIFGEVTEGYDVVAAIAEVETGPGDRPTSDITIDRIDIAE